MSTRFTDEQREFARAVREFCQRECGTAAQRSDLTDHGRTAHSGTFFAKLAATGYLGVSIPEEYGGSGGGLVEQVLLFEELYYGLAPAHGAGSTHTVAGVYKHYATEEQKRSALGALVAGAVMSISVSEPEAGSDAARISCRAEHTPDGYRINGHKTWCTDAQFAERILLVARTGRGERPHHGLTMLEVPADAAGLAIHPIETMGGREVNDLYFTDVVVPAANVIGEPGQGWRQLMSGLNGERLVCAAQGLGMARRTFDDLVGYLRTREQFGQPIGTFQAVGHRVADLAIEIEAAKALLYEATARIEAGDGPPGELVRLTSMTKVKVTETAKKVALEGVQLMGGYGYAVEFGMEAHLRRAVAPTIYAGTNEIQRNIIASSYGLPC